MPEPKFIWGKKPDFTLYSDKSHIDKPIVLMYINNKLRGTTMDLKQDSALKRLIFRTLWNFVAILITSVIAYLTDNYNNMAWYPVVLYLLTTAKDIANKQLPNLPKEQ